MELCQTGVSEGPGAAGRGDRPAEGVGGYSRDFIYLSDAGEVWGGDGVISREIFCID